MPECAEDNCSSLRDFDLDVSEDTAHEELLVTNIIDSPIIPLFGSELNLVDDFFSSQQLFTSDYLRPMVSTSGKISIRKMSSFSVTLSVLYPIKVRARVFG